MRVKSSNIKSISYNEGLKTLIINFVNSGPYKYFNVPKKVYIEFKTFPSKGKFFYSKIRGIYDFKKI